MNATIEYFKNELIKITWLSATTLTLIAIYLLILIQKRVAFYKQLTNELGYQMPEISSVFLGHAREHAFEKKQAEWYVKFGKTYGFYNIEKAHLRVADLNMIQEIFLKQSRNFTARTWHEWRLSLFQRGILFSHEKRWRRARRLFQPTFSIYRMTAADDGRSELNGELKRGLKAMIDHFKHLIKADEPTPSGQQQQQRALPSYAEIDDLGFVPVRDAASPTGYSLDIKAHGVMEVITLDIILRVGLEVDQIDVVKGLRNPIMKDIDLWLASFDDPLARWSQAVPLLRFLIPFYLMFNKGYRVYMSFLNNLFKEHNDRLAKEEEQQQQERDKMGDRMERRRRESRAQPPVSIFKLLMAEFRAGRLNKADVLANAGATVVAGFETTATTSSYILWCIARHAEQKARLLEDIQREGYQSRYLDMFIKEVMRMYPALANFVLRSPKEDTLVAGRPIKRGMSVYLGVNSVHYDETIWPEPHKFDPERFAEGKTHPPGAYVPFGLGHRMCVGVHLAMREMKLIVAEILTNFDVELIAPLGKLERESLTIFLTRAKHDIRVRLIPRRVDLAVAANNISPVTTTNGDHNHNHHNS